MEPSEELKPCPFCGGEAALRIIRYGTAGRSLVSVMGYEIMCEQCSVSNIEGEYSNQEDAISAWNKRVQPTPQQ